MKSLILIALLSSTQVFAAELDANALSRCVIAIAQSPYFHRHTVEVDSRAMPTFHYVLGADGIRETKVYENRIWSFKTFADIGDTAGRIALQTKHAQLGLVTKAFENLIEQKDKLTATDVADLGIALNVCEEFRGASLSTDPQAKTVDLGSWAAWLRANLKAASNSVN